MRGNLPLIQFDLLKPFPRILCAASTRQGGVSAAPFESLNLGFSRGDDQDRVRENRRRFLEALGVEPGSVVVGQQVHGADVRTVGRAERGRGALDPLTGIPESDGLVTVDPGVFLFSVSADCPLVGVLAPPDRGVALAHSGWRGLASGIPGAAVAALARAAGVEPREMVAVIGPAIGRCCYQVGEEVVEKLPPAARRAARPDGPAHYRLDLRQAIARQLEEAGLDPEKVRASPECSSCDKERFFSHRRDGPATGRIAMVVGIRE